jgi:alkylated DNA repair dioxygenase AlkB
MTEIIVNARSSFQNIPLYIIKFLKTLSYDGYVLAGHCASNIMTDTTIRDLDFFIYKDFEKVFEKEFMFENSTYKYYHGFIEIETPNMLINLIYYVTDILTPYDIINNFDFSYVKSFIRSNDLKIHTLAETLECLATKIIHNVGKKPQDALNRFNKAKNYGYIFSQNIIKEFSPYFINGKLIKSDKIKGNYIFKSNHEWFVLKMLSVYPLEIIKNYDSSNEKPKKISIKKKVIKEEEKPKKISIKKKVIESDHEDEIFEPVKVKLIFNSDDEEKVKLTFESDKEEEELIIYKNIKKVCESEEYYCNVEDNYTIKYLDEENYIVKSFIPDKLKNYIKENFEEMFLLHPEKKHGILFGKNKHEVEVHRYQKNYGMTPPLFENNDKSYMYSNSKSDRNSEPKPPEIFKPLIECINEDNEYNQFVINWYDVGDYIAEHSDCDAEMINNFKITTLHIIENESFDNEFEFKIRKKNEHEAALKIPLKQGQYISMLGPTFQNSYTHGVKKGGVRRINISFRQFIQ